MLRASLFVAACAFLSLPAVHAQAVACTEEEESWLVANYQTYVDKLDAGCASELCASTCVDAKLDIEYDFPLCDFHDGNNYRELAMSLYGVCTSAKIPACTTENGSAFKAVNEVYDPESCVSTPCESTCNGKLLGALGVIPYCTSSDGTVLWNYYFSLTESCPKTEKTETPELAATSSASSAASNSTDGSDATTDTTTTETSASTDAATTEGSAASEETEATTSEASGSPGSATSATPTPTPTSGAVASCVGAITTAVALVVATTLA